MDGKALYDGLTVTSLPNGHLLFVFAQAFLRPWEGLEEGAKEKRRGHRWSPLGVVYQKTKLLLHTEPLVNISGPEGGLLQENRKGKIRVDCLCP